MIASTSWTGRDSLIKAGSLSGGVNRLSGATSVFLPSFGSLYSGVSISEGRAALAATTDFTAPPWGFLSVALVDRRLLGLENMEDLSELNVILELYAVVKLLFPV